MIIDEEVKWPTPGRHEDVSGSLFGNNTATFHKLVDVFDVTNVAADRERWQGFIQTSDEIISHYGSELDAADVVERFLSFYVQARSLKEMFASCNFKGDRPEKVKAILKRINKISPGSVRSRLRDELICVLFESTITKTFFTAKLTAVKDKFNLPADDLQSKWLEFVGPLFCKFIGVEDFKQKHHDDATRERLQRVWVVFDSGRSEVHKELKKLLKEA
ncbi:hypothetical protein VARIO8X_120082 [Burkholderiales bacterium 8X]|nr:hypothetical protein VARIO8X_120082 [Burkholderiales bacterium 8X]